MSTMTDPVRRVLLTRSNTKMTDAIMTRRAQQIAAQLGFREVQIDKGTTQEPERPWRFKFFRTNTPGSVAALVLEVSGTRGAVYTALGNYGSGISTGIEDGA